jgi:hypothetical protein
VQTDSGYLTTDLKYQQYNFLESVKFDIDMFHTDSSIKYVATFESPQIYNVYFRSYLKMQDLTAKIGGFLTLINSIGTLFCFYFTEKVYFLEQSKKIINFEKDEEFNPEIQLKEQQEIIPYRNTNMNSNTNANLNSIPNISHTVRMENNIISYTSNHFPLEKNSEEKQTSFKKNNNDNNSNSKLNSFKSNEESKRISNIETKKNKISKDIQVDYKKIDPNKLNIWTFIKIKFCCKKKELKNSIDSLLYFNEKCTDITTIMKMEIDFRKIQDILIAMAKNENEKENENALFDSKIPFCKVIQDYNDFRSSQVEE